MAFLSNIRMLFLFCCNIYTKYWTYNKPYVTFINLISRFVSKGIFMSRNFAFIFLFILAAFAMVAGLLLLAKTLRPNKPNPEKLSSYESGEQTEGDAIISFNIRFYVIAIIFLLFEVELVLLFPWATVFGNAELISETNGQWALYAIGEMFIFIFLLALGLVYAWREGHLDWIKAKSVTSDFKPEIPLQAYDVINEKYK
jgi:NADH-quinone oxidoreductase subunit A